MGREVGQELLLGFKHSHTSVKKCKKMSPTTPKWIPILRDKIPWYPKILEQCLGTQSCPNCGLVKPLKIYWRLNIQSVFTNLDIWNTSYDQKNGWNYQLDSQSLNCPTKGSNHLCMKCAIWCGKMVFQGYNFVF
jgi:hypothetical protein